MKGRDVKRRPFFYEPFEKAALTRLLEEEEARGWRLTGLDTGLVFARSAPKQARYSPALVDSADPYDVNPSEETREYMDYCAAAGWAYVCGSGKWRIFRTEDPDAPSIESDPALELELVHSVCKKSRNYHIMLAGVMGLLLILSAPVWNWVRFCTQYSNWGWGFVLLCFFGASVCYVTEYTLWRRAQKRRAALGETVAYLPHNRLSRGQMILHLWLPIAGVAAAMVPDLAHGNQEGVETAIALLWLIPLALGGVLVSCFLRRRKNDPETNRIFGPVLLVLVMVLFLVGRNYIQEEEMEQRLFHTVIPITVEGEEYRLYRDEIPLALDDLGVAHDAGLEERRVADEGRALIASLWCFTREANPWSGGRKPSLSYRVYASGVPFLFEKCLEEYEYLISEGGKPVQVPGLSAGAVYFREDEGRRTWLAVYEDCLFEVSANFEVTAQMLATAEEKLLAWAAEG